jgi:hypothetical protein
MKLFKITWKSSTVIPGLYSPLFLEAPNEMRALSKFITLYESKSEQFAPRNIEATQICKLKEIIKYE